MTSWLLVSMLITFLQCKIDGKLLLCTKVSTSIGKDVNLKKTINFLKPLQSISNIFSYTTINISADSPFQVTITNDSSYFTGLTSSKYQTVFIKDRISCFEDFQVTLDLQEPTNILIKLLGKSFDVRSFTLFIIGCLLLINAKYLSRSTSFMYTSCASVGVLASCLIFLLVLYKFMPYKRVMAFLMTVGSGMWFYFLNHLQHIIGKIIVKYPYHVMTYLSTSALTAISILYYFGTPSSERTLNLFQWLMQLSATYIIYANCYNKTFPVTIIVLLLFFQIFSFQKTISVLLNTFLPRRLMMWMNPPPKHRFLTMEEYEKQTREATEKGLKDLKDFCTSPKCNSWEMISRLKEPKRFANFLRSGDQFTNDEVDAYYVEDELDLDEDDIFEQSVPDNLELQNDLHRNGNIDKQPSITDWMSEDEKADNSTLLTD